jgi:hypothetical protein
VLNARRRDRISATSETVLKQIESLYRMLLHHDGFGEMRVEMRILKRGQKEGIIHCGKQYRHVVDFNPPREARSTDNG